MPARTMKVAFLIKVYLQEILNLFGIHIQTLHV